MIRIIMDAFGGDNAPAAVVAGAALALNRFNDITITLCGREDAVRAELQKHSFDAQRMAVLDASEVIDCHEAPTLAIKRKKDSSLVKSLAAVANGEADCVVSAGSTGALLTGATLIVRRIKGVKRPALAPLLPTRTGRMADADRLWGECGLQTILPAAVRGDGVRLHEGCYGP